MTQEDRYYYALCHILDLVSTEHREKMVGGTYKSQAKANEVLLDMICEVIEETLKVSGESP